MRVRSEEHQSITWLRLVVYCTTQHAAHKASSVTDAREWITVNVLQENGCCLYPICSKVSTAARGHMG